MQTAATNNLILIESSSRAGFGTQRIFFQAFKTRNVLSEFAARLVQLTRNAYKLRDVPTLQEASLMLMNLPLDAARQIGLYYRAKALSLNGQKEEARFLLEKVAHSAPLAYRARAIQGLGIIHHQRGQYDEALRFYAEAARAVSKSHSDLLVAFLACLNASCIRGTLGDHSGALADLERLSPLARITARQSPFHFYHYHNALAVELAEVGRLSEAEAAISVALGSPFAAAYPEWSETRDEILAKRQAATPSVVAISRAQETKPQQLTPAPVLAHHATDFQTPDFGIVPSGPVILKRIHRCVESRGPPAHN